jgi:hypothetical protein
VKVQIGGAASQIELREVTDKRRLYDEVEAPRRNTSSDKEAEVDEEEFYLSINLNISWSLWRQNWRRGTVRRRRRN